jgi:hypothetical protein
LTALGSREQVIMLVIFECLPALARCSAVVRF